VSLLRVLPALGWTALIAWLSTGQWSADETAAFLLPLLKRVLPWAAPEQLQAVHWLARKTAHVVEYAVLAALWRWALTAANVFRGAVAPLGLSVLTATLDERHQATTVTRAGSFADVLLDSTGAVATVIVLSVGPRRSVQWLTNVLLWLAAAGGSTLLVVNWGAGAPSGWLWWSVSGAWIALGARLVIYTRLRQIRTRSATPPRR
jgi:VanZ family protein